jgi:2-oxoglutarate dehydrogenase E1 component
MYSEIRKHPAISDIYAARLVREGVIDVASVESMVAEFTALLEEEFEAAKTYLPNKADWFEGRWAGLGKPDTPATERRNVVTALDEQTLREVGQTLTTIPADLEVHKTLVRIIDAKRRMFESGEGLRLGDGRSARLRERSSSRAMRCACRARTVAAARSASATPCGSIRTPPANISP